MSDFFIHNGDSFLPDYLPGIIGYGQNGAQGNQGESAPSIYYAAYNFDFPSEIKEAQKRILNNQQLSDNRTLDNDNEYKVNDVIVDRNGTFYKITKLNKTSVIINKCANTSESNYSNITTAFCGFNVKCSTSFLKSSARKWIKDNPYYDPDIRRVNYSPKVYHHNKLEKYIYGNSITFNLIPTSTTDTNKYSYKFVLVLPNGQTFDFYSDSNVCTIFLENKILFGCFSTNEWNNLMNFNKQDLKETALSKLMSLDEELDIDDISENLGTFTKIDPLKYVNDEISARGRKRINGKYHSATYGEYYYHNTGILSLLKRYDALDLFKEFDEENDTIEKMFIEPLPTSADSSSFSSNYDHLEQFLKTKEITMLLSYFIKYECSAYCEITDNETGVIYRVDINDIFVTETLNKNDNRNNFIKEVVNNVTWNHELIKYKPDLNDSNNFNNFLTYKYIYEQENGNTGEIETVEETRLFNPMNAYVVFSHQEDITAGKNTITEDGVIENLYFVDASGFTEYLNYTDLTALQNGGYPTGISSNGFCPNGTAATVRDETNKDTIGTICSLWGVTRTQDSSGGVTIYKNRDSNRIIKLSFSNLSSIKVNIQYLKQTSPATTYPQALIYIGYIDHPLLILPKKEEEQKEGDEEPGIYYLTKVVPPGYYVKETESDYTTTSLAGMTESTINLADFGIYDTKTHYIEIGVTLLDTEGKTRAEINNTHRKSYTSINGYRLFKFDYEDEQNVTKYEHSGKPDIRIYVSGVQEYTDEKITQSEDKEINYNNFNSIHCDKPKDIDTRA